jgi:hypothetical protein
MSMKKILITPRSLSDLSHPALEMLRSANYEVIGSTPGQTPTEEELISLMGSTVGWLATAALISDNRFDEITRLVEEVVKTTQQI